MGEPADADRRARSGKAPPVYHPRTRGRKHNPAPIRLRLQGRPGGTMSLPQPEPAMNHPAMNPPLLTAGLPGCGGTIRARDDDFEVEEVPSYEPCGTGDHLFLWVE